jgi:hypothetical protein
LLGHGADRVDLLVDVARTQLIVATDTSLQVDEGVRGANGPPGVPHLLSRVGEALTRVASRFHSASCWACSRLGADFGGRPGPRRSWPCGVSVGVLLARLEGLCSRRQPLVGGTLCGGQRCCNRLAQLMLSREDVGGVLGTEVMGTVGQQPWRLVARRSSMGSRCT